MKLRTIGILAPCAIIIAALLWAIDGVVLTPWIFDLGLHDVPTFVFMLHITASIFLSYFMIARRSEFKKLDAKDWIAFVLTGLFGGALGTMAIVAAIINVHSNHLNISVVLLLQKMQPIFALLLAILWLRERPKKVFYLWTLIALAGSYFLTFGFAKPDFSAYGMFVPAMLALLAAFSFGSSTVFSKKAIAKISHGLGTALRFFMTTGIMLLIISAITGLNAAGVDTSYEGFRGFEAINWNLIGAFVIIALTTGGTAIFIYYWGLKRVPASRSTILEMAFPVGAILFEFLIHGQLLTTGQWVGAFAVFFAIVMITRLGTTQPAPVH